MPLYEYECQSCGTRSEVIQRFSDAPLTTCEACGGELRKLLSAPAFQLKGSGWYKTDYASSRGGAKGKESSSSSSDSSSDSSSKDSSSSDSSSKETAAKEGSGKKKAETASSGS